MGTARRDTQGSDLPDKLSNPARRALVAAVYVRLEQLTQISEAEILVLHGVGPNALELLRRALRANGQSFGNGERGHSSS